MSDEDPLVNGQPLSSLRVVDLREELEKHGLAKSGNKNVLVDRLRQYLVDGVREEATPTKEKATALASPTKSPVAENPLVAQYKAKQQAALKEAAIEKERVRRESESSEQLTSPSRGKDVEPLGTPEKTTVKEDAANGQKIKDDTDSGETEKPTDNQHEKTSEVDNTSDVEEEKNVSSEDPVKDDTVEVENSVAKDASPSPKKCEPKSRSSSPKKDAEIDDDNKEDGVELDYGEAEEIVTEIAEDEQKEEEKKDEVMDVESPVKRKRRISVEPPKEEEGAAKRGRQISPSRYPKSEILHIRGLMRPFTIPLLKVEICKQGGEIVDFWIDNIRSHCFVKMRSDDEAESVREALHGVSWPTSNPKTLAVQYDNSENMERHKSGKTVAPTSNADSVSRTLSTDSQSETKERRERPTLAPLPGRNGSLRVTVEAMVRDNIKKEEETRERIEKESKERARELEKRIKVRLENKKEDSDNKKPLKRERSETPPHSRSVQDEKKRERKDFEKRDEKVRHNSEVEKKEEKPVKTADEFFKKTKAQPSIYYLPLTDEEAEARAAKKTRERP